MQGMPSEARPVGINELVLPREMNGSKIPAPKYSHPSIPTLPFPTTMHVQIVSQRLRQVLPAACEDRWPPQQHPGVFNEPLRKGRSHPTSDVRSAMARQMAKLAPGLLAAARGVCNSGCPSGLQAMAPAFKLLSSCGELSFRSMHTSFPSQVAHDADASKQGEVKIYEPSRKFRPLADKELWHEAWMYEDRFGTEEDPILVPSLESERIIGVTDPEDDNLVVWGILRANEAPRQFIEGGEYYLLKKVPYVAKVGDVLEGIDSGATPISK